MTTKQKMMKVKLIRSIYGRKPGHAACVKGLGLRKIHQTVEVLDTPCTRGMVTKAAYLLQVEEA